MELIELLRQAGAPGTWLGGIAVVAFVADKLYASYKAHRQATLDQNTRERELLSADERSFRESLTAMVANLRREVHDSRNLLLVAQTKLEECHNANSELRRLNGELRDEIGRLRDLLGDFERRFGTVTGNNGAPDK